MRDEKRRRSQKRNEANRTFTESPTKEQPYTPSAKQTPRNSIRPIMNASDDSRTPQKSSVDHKIQKVSSKLNNKDRQEFERKLRTWSLTSIDEVCCTVTKATPMLFFSDGAPQRIHSWSESLDKLLQDPVGIQNFFIHLKSEHSTENIRFWLACENFKSCNTSELRESANQIYNEFLSRNSGHQVNVPCALLKEVRKEMCKPTPKTFENVQYEIYNLMKTDSYPRFLKSARYLSFIKDKTPPEEAKK